MEPREHLKQVFGSEPRSVVVTKPPRDPMMDLITRIQQQSAEWRAKNFPPKSYDPITTSAMEQALGVCEEAGEMAHHVLKMVQQIRGTREEHLEQIEDACGDIFIYMCGLATRLDFDLHDAFQKAWDEVKQRDWEKNSFDGKHEFAGPHEETELKNVTQTEGGALVKSDHRPQITQYDQSQAPQFTGEICRECGNATMIRTGSCSTCSSCGWNDGCG